MTKINADAYLPLEHPLLKQAVEEVAIHQIGSPEIEAIIEKLLNIARSERGAGSMVGLAAPQIGIPKAIILVDMHIDEARKPEDFNRDLTVFINPRITWRSEEVTEFREGCYSTGDLRGIVPRAKIIHLEAFSRTGELVSLQAEGYTARIFQHEVDHLHGIRFPDRMTDFSKLHWVKEEEIEEYRRTYETWPRTCSHGEWCRLIGAK